MTHEDTYIINYYLLLDPTDPDVLQKEVLQTETSGIYESNVEECMYFID